jgi:ankyrin repeat protein
LLSAAVNPGETDEGGHTPPHLAAYFGDADSVAALLAANAQLHINDKGDRTALDWAIHKGHAGLVESLRAKGAASKTQAKAPVAPNRATPTLETGVKIIDFCAPLKRGGVNAIFSSKSGVGKVVQTECLM